MRGVVMYGPGDVRVESGRIRAVIEDQRAAVFTTLRIHGRAGEKIRCDGQCCARGEGSAQ